VTGRIRRAQPSISQSPVIMFLKLVASLLGAAGAYALYWTVRFVYREVTSPWRSLRGPPSTHWFYGNLKEFMEDARFPSYLLFSSK
jgi:hypothetical protein